jgi:hypothetical protein
MTRGIVSIRVTGRQYFASTTAVERGRLTTYADWRDLLLDLKRRGLDVPPRLVIADGALGQTWRPWVQRQVARVHGGKRTIGVFDSVRGDHSRDGKYEPSLTCGPRALVAQMTRVACSRWQIGYGCAAKTRALLRLRGRVGRYTVSWACQRLTRCILHCCGVSRFWRPDGAGVHSDMSCTGQEMERLGRRSIRLLSAGWLPPSVFRLGAFPASRRRASGRARPHSLASDRIAIGVSVPVIRIAEAARHRSRLLRDGRALIVGKLDRIVIGPV